VERDVEERETYWIFVFASSEKRARDVAYGGESSVEDVE
jgi:hypothetical protein